MLRNVLQLKQSQARPGTYTVTDPRTPEEQAAAAELSSRLAKLRTEQQSSASQAELQEQQASVSKAAGDTAAEEEVPKPVKQKKPRTPKVRHCPDHVSCKEVIALMCVYIIQHH